jgi:small-conductance mechanosensitive channel
MQADDGFRDKILAPIEVAGVDGFADSGVKIKARFKTLPTQQWNVGREYNRRLKSAFDKAGISIPYPHVHVVGMSPLGAQQDKSDHVQEPETQREN